MKIAAETYFEDHRIRMTPPQCDYGPLSVELMAAPRPKRTASEVDVAVAKVEGVRQSSCCVAELAAQLTRGFAPVGFLQ